MSECSASLGTGQLVAVGAYLTAAVATREGWNGSAYGTAHCPLPTATRISGLGFSDVTWISDATYLGTVSDATMLHTWIPVPVLNSTSLSRCETFLSALEVDTRGRLPRLADL